MANYVLLIGLIIITLISIYIFKDIFAPASLVCESFLLAFICACFSSSMGGWKFALHYSTVFIMLIGLWFFFIGSFLAKCQKNKRPEKRYIAIINPPLNKLITLLIIQVILLIIYIYYYRIAISQFGLMDWGNMIRAYRFAGSYGEGLQFPIPDWVNQLIKFSRANGYVALYILIHNFTIHKYLNRKVPHLLILSLIFILYLPYNLLNAARFELIVILSMGLVIWYTYYRQSANIIGEQQFNIKKAIGKIAVIILISFIGFSAIAPLVGRTQSEGIITQTMDYLGRSLQAFDNYVERPNLESNKSNIETFYNVAKFLKQIHIVDDDVEKIHMEFTSQNGYSLGNTYTAFRRYYADLDIIGVLLFSTLGGYILSFAYIKTKYPVFGKIDYKFQCYTAVIFSAFLYCFDDYIFASIISFNYLLIFVFLYLVCKWINGELEISGSKLSLKL